MRQGAVAIVTGASRGIGRACAEAIAQKGCSIFLVADGSEAELSAVEESCHKAGAPQVAIAVIDLGVPGEPERMIETASTQMGRVDVLVNNAGVRCPKMIGDFTRDDFNRVFAINVAAALFASQAALPIMRGQGGGRIINIASQMGSVAARGNGLYGPTKAALIHLTKVMALEYAADNVLVNCVSPGPIATDYTLTRLGHDTDAKQTLLNKVPLGRFGMAGEVAEVVAFLAMMKGTFIHGADILIDGGYVIH